ncbi:hypothetical protein PG993_004830 [Apiospora rasikravindrae]|uniref:Uncharacterized protein n=1 Tax=Apiospora rasikravindrae TaxID=990691 RepID=A0ABR1TDW5_9PEZI
MWNQLFNNPKTGYGLLGRVDDDLDSSDTGSSRGEGSGSAHEKTQRSLHGAHVAILLTLNVALFIISIAFFAATLQSQNAKCGGVTEENARNGYLRPVSMFCSLSKSCTAPVLDETDIGIEKKRMDATLLQRVPPVIYREEPSRKVDEAWQALWDTRPIPLTAEHVRRMGKDPSEAVRIPSDWGYGEDAYFGRLDVFHQMHCLDALRREVYFDHYYGKRYPGGFNTTSEFHRLHLSHCTYLLMQNIMCNANTDVYTHIWTDTLTHPFPDFNIDHKCKNFEAVVAWQNENALDEKAFVALTRPEGYPFRKMTHKFKEIHGWLFGPDDMDDGSGEIA